jgi:hypothetical protein
MLGLTPCLALLWAGGGGAVCVISFFKASSKLLLTMLGMVMG